MPSTASNIKHASAEASSDDGGYRSAGSNSDSDSDSLDSTEPRKRRRTSRSPNGDGNESDGGDDAEDSDVPFVPTKIVSSFSAPSRIKRNPAAAATSTTSKEQAQGEGGESNVDLSELLPSQKTVLAPTDPDTSFESLGVRPWLVQSLSNMAIKRPTGIQKGCIPELLKGRDCIGGSRTGSGKTVAFAVPILQKWAEDPSAIFAVILTPTR